MAIDPRSVLPTKINLINLRRSYATIRRIRRVLEDKREVLLLNIRIAIEEFTRLQNSVREKLKKAYEKYSIAVSQAGLVGLRSIESSTRKAASVIVGERAAFGIKIPVLTIDRESIQKPEYPPGTTPYSLDVSIELLRDALEEIVKLAEAEATLKRLIEELRRTQKLINAIDYLIIPNYVNTIKRIRSVLEERMREEFIRLKLMKKKLVARGAARG
ncbi:MAG: V-type ATP synthase subunit D [Sulfolobales archaeon]